MLWRAFLIAALLLPALLVAPVGAADVPAHEWEERFKELRAAERAQVFDLFETTPHVFKPLDSDRARVSADESSRQLAGGERYPHFVFGIDDRQQLTPADPRVAYIEAIDDDTGMAALCSAAFIGLRVLLTAAHCLYDNTTGASPEAVAVVPGKDGDSEPYGFAFAEGFAVPQAWIDSTGEDLESLRSDYGIIVLANNDLGNAVGHVSLGALSDATLLGANLDPRTTGYPSDKPAGTQWTHAIPTVDQVTDVFIYTQHDVVEGQSGSPVMRGFDSAVLGIVSFGYSDDSGDYNIQRRVTREVIDFALGVCAEAGCAFDYFDEAQNGDTTAIQRAWQRTDLPVATGAVGRTWMWGPKPNTGIYLEPYAEAPGSLRAVIYYDKTRMEITVPSGDVNSPWYITNGLLVVELVTGRLQLGDATFEDHEPAQVNVAGDADDPDGPKYAAFGPLLGATPHATGSTITARVDGAGSVSDDPAMAGFGVTAQQFVPETNHTVASVFWNFMNSQGPVYENGAITDAQLFLNAFFATGFPITEAYWSKVRVGGTVKDVLIQVFERRVMTYTPSNSGGFQVESGNVGQHYRTWRYEQLPGNGGGDIPTVGEPIGGTDFSDVGPLDDPSGATGDSTENSYVITAPPMSALLLLVDANLGDFALSIDTRLLTPSEVSLSCLIFRADLESANPSFYDYCLWYEGPNSLALVITYVTQTDQPILAAWEFTEPVPPGTDWHILSLIAQADTFWIFFDDSYVGSAQHADGPGSGLIGAAAYNLAETGEPAQIEITNLLAWNLAE